MYTDITRENSRGDQEKTTGHERTKRFGFNSSSPLKLFATFAVIAALLLYVDFGAVFDTLAKLNIYVFSAVLGLLCIQLLVSSYRWHIILKSLDQPVTFRESLNNFVAGSLGNLLFLTSIGGLSVRAFLMAKEGTQLNVIAASLVIERIVAVISLLAAFFLGAFILSTEFSLASDLLQNKTLLIGIFAFVSICISAFLLVRFLLDFENNGMGSFLNNVLVLVRQPLQSSVILSGSFLVHFLGFAAIGIIAFSIGENVPTLMLFAVMPAIALLSSIPVGLGGWGIREGSMVLGFSILQIPAEQAIAISVLYGLAGILATLIFAALFLTRSRSHSG